MAERLALQRAAEVLDAAAKYAFHSKRATLTVPDLRLAGGAPGHGDASAPLPELLYVPDAADLLCRAEAELSTNEAMATACLPVAPLEAGIAPHWLAVAGVQPATVENAQPRRAVVPNCTTRGPGSAVPRSGPLAAAPAPGAGQQADEAGGVLAALPLKHSLPEELQLYFSAVRRALQSRPGAPGSGMLAGRAVAASLATDPGLQPMLPYLVPLLADEVSKNLGDAMHLHVILSAMRGLLSNPDLHLLPYVHHVLPAILTCLLARNIGSNEEHWGIRDEAASLVSLIAQRSQQQNDALAAALARVQQALASALFADAPATQYGSLVGLTAFGVPVLLSTVVPVLGRYSQLFQEGEQSASSLHVRAALMMAIGRCISWNGGAHAPVIMQFVSDASFRSALQAVAPGSTVHL